MSKNRNLIAIVLASITIGIFVQSGCTKDVTVTIKPTIAEITKTVLFSKDIVPLLTANCAITGCHAAGGHSPILTADKAYSSLMNSPGLIAVSDPANSQVYLRLTGKIVPAMPLSAPASDPSFINEYILAWIKQGAKNN